MKTATITEAKNGLSALLHRVRHGESVVITDRGVPIARIEAISAAEGDEARLLRLERAGLIVRGRGRPPVELIRQPPPKLSPGASVVEALLEERRTGR